MKLLIPLFSPATGTWGGVTRVVALHDAACRAGHQVAFCASGEMAAGLKKHGYIVYSTPPTSMFGLPAPVSRILEQRSQRMSIPVRPGKSIGSLWMVMFLSGLGRAGYLKKLVEAQRAAVRDFQADAIFTDIDPAAYLTAAIERLPMCANYADVMRTGIGGFAWKRMNAAIGPVLKANGLTERSIDELFFAPEVLKIIPSIPELDGTDPNRADVRYVGQLLGPVQPGSSFSPESGMRYVFAYLGTGSLSLDAQRRVLPQVFPASGSLRCLVGAQSLQADEEIGGVRFSRYVPADAVLPHCDWVICHGGQNTIIQALLNGVPLIIFPGPVFERRFNASKVQEAGAGWMGERDQFTPVWLEKALQTRAERTSRAAELGARIRSYGGADAAIGAIAETV